MRHGIEEFGLGRGARPQLPGALALQRALRQTLLACGPQQAAARIAETAFEFVVGPRQARHIVAVEQAGALALADLVEVGAKPPDSRWEIGSRAPRVEIASQLGGALARTPG